MYFSYASLKRLFDLAFSTAVLICTSPLLLLIALAIKCTSKGPILFLDKRLGLGGKTIKCYKFRTMYCDAEHSLSRLLSSNKELLEEWNRYHKLRHDPRITPLGKFLRRTSLDEFPQFFNVLTGDFSVVGPRPFPVSFGHKTFQQKAPIILSVKPGITGLWQTSGRSTLTLEQRLSIDERYAKTCSFLLDLRLILKTIPIVLLSRGAF